MARVPNLTKINKLLHKTMPQSFISKGQFKNNEAQKRSEEFNFKAEVPCGSSRVYRGKHLTGNAKLFQSFWANTWAVSVLYML